MNIALLLIRVVVGGILAAHGSQKVFGWFGGHGLRATGQFLESLGFRPGHPYALLLGGSELIGGLALGSGFVTPLAAAAVAAVMLAAIAVVHWQKGFLDTGGGYEFPLVLAVAAIAMAFSGPGRWSIDHAVDWTLSGEKWGIVAIVIAVIISGAVATARALRLRRHGPVAA